MCQKKKKSHPVKQLVGSADPSASTLRSAKPLANSHRNNLKAVFHVDNVDTEITTDDVVQYLDRNGVKVVSCFVAKSWVDADCASFWVCICASDRNKLINDALWPAGVVVRPWKFKSSHPDLK